MTLNLTATTTEEKVLKEYLEQNASEVLADKINNGVQVEKDGKKLFYGLDGGWLTGKEWSYLYRTAKPVDCAIFDTTCGEQPGNFRIGTHNTIPMVRLLVEAFKENEVMREGGKYIASHMGPHIHGVPAEETARILAEFGVIMAYDGFETEI